VRYAVPVCLALLGCNDLRDYQGDWQGHRVGDAPVLRVGVAATANATLTVEDVDSHGLRALLAIDNVLPPTELTSLPGAEADALADLTFSGSPLKVYLAFVPMADGAGDAMLVVSLVDNHRIDLRIMRQGTSPIYAIFAFAAAPP
jgi:hypothetical protein